MAEAARLRGVSRNAIANLARRGKLQSYEVGGRKLVNRTEVLAFQPQPIGRPAKKRVQRTSKMDVKAKK
jgi:excisionase family DNA binding protein